MGVSYVNVVLYCTAVVCSGVRIYALWSVGANHLTRKTYGTVRIGAMFEENHTVIIFATNIAYILAIYYILGLCL